mgnify:CR=1 FL=1
MRKEEFLEKLRARLSQTIGNLLICNDIYNDTESKQILYHEKGADTFVPAP